MGGREGLGHSHVEARGEDVSVFECHHERILVVNLAPRCIHKDGRSPHSVKCVGVEERLS